MRKMLSALALCAVILQGPTAATAQGQGIGTTPLLDLVAAARGKVVVLNFFASFCPPCRLEIPGLMELRSRFSPGEVEIIGISVDNSLEDMENFIRKYDFNYPVYYGGQELGYAFRISAIPHNIVYDRQGRMAYNQPGYLPGDELAALLRDVLDRDS
ncbi:MAG: TlpA family protein disulfide reductase [Desulfovibrionaceae bacterium]|nr:TlpA family protein disulfide reductase [Desulfovibrionaceae bacterium]